MKWLTWILTLAVLLGPCGSGGLAFESAFAAEAAATPATSLSTSADDQRNSQNNNKSNNDQGSSQSSMMGMMAIMAGMAMMAAGAAMMAMPPSAAAGAALMAAGAMMLASGMAAMSAAKEMNKNANASGINGFNMDNLTTPTISGELPKNLAKSTATGLTPGLAGLDPSKLGDTSGGGSTMSIDPAVLASGGKTDALVEDFENKTGISRAEFVEGLNSGKNPTDMLAGSSGMKKAGVGADKINSLVADANSSGNLLSGNELLDKVGMSAADIAAMAAKNGGMGDGDAYALNGGGASRSPASSSSTTDYSFQGAPKEAGVTSAGLGSAANFSNGHLSDNVQSALDRSGITNRSIFQMVHEQYKKKMPMMFGAQERKAASHSDNPFADLAKDKVEL